MGSKRDARKARRLARWPETGGVPPWVASARLKAKTIARLTGKALTAAVEALLPIAAEAVKRAALEAVTGEIRRSKAVGWVVEKAGADPDVAVIAVQRAFDAITEGDE